MRNPEDAHIFITNDLEQTFTSLLSKQQFSSIVILVDDNTGKHCLPKVLPILPDAHVIRIKHGEEEKTLATCEKIWNEMTALQLDRKALLVNLGGGVIGDMGGFCAATYKRGISFIQVPTTLLSEVDASVGGKLGIDFHQFKNQIGVFQVPDAVVIHTNFLQTLPFEELRSGYAEVIKHCLIADKAKWDLIKSQSIEDQDWDEIADHSVRIKAHIADVDPLEKGLRKILNFGHTIGHAIESFYLLQEGKKLLHGEAIAIGMIAEAWLSFKRGFIALSEAEEIKTFILCVYGKTTIPKNDLDEIIPLTSQDKKNEHNVIQCTLLEEIGKANFNNPIDATDIREAIAFYNA